MRRENNDKILQTHFIIVFFLVPSLSNSNLFSVLCFFFLILKSIATDAVRFFPLSAYFWIKHKLFYTTGMIVFFLLCINICKMGHNRAAGETAFGGLRTIKANHLCASSSRMMVFPNLLLSFNALYFLPSFTACSDIPHLLR